MFPRELVEQHRLVPVAEITDASAAVDLAKALVDGGLPVIEVTLRTPAAADAIRAVAAANMGVALGAGTVVSVDQVKLARDAGATYIVSPGLNTSVVEYCLKEKLPVLPGVCTPTEVEMARGLGLNTLKFFPAEAFGGVKTLKAMSAVYGDFRFVPTGGVNVNNVLDYLALPTVIACGGSWMVPKDVVTARDFAKVTTLTKEAVAKVKA